MILSDLGKTAENCWREIPRHFPFVKLDEFVIMPNHIHGIIIIEKPMICNMSGKFGESNESMGFPVSVETQNFASLPSHQSQQTHGSNETYATQQSDMTQQSREPNELHVTKQSQKTHGSNETHTTQQSDAMQQSRESSTPHETVSNFGPQSKNIASIIRGFKIGVTKYAMNNNIPFEWQGRYYDHIIRDENDLNRIRKYIIKNPSKWEMDEYTEIQSAQSTSAKEE